MKRTIIMAFALSAIYINVQCMNDDKNNDQKKPLLLNDLAASSSTAASNGSIDDQNVEHRINKDEKDKNVSAGASSSSQASGNIYLSLLDDLEKGTPSDQMKLKIGRSLAASLPQPNDFYTGTLYPANSTTYFQFWNAYKIPESEVYRSGPQLDEYVRNRAAVVELLQEQEAKRQCCDCLGQTCCCVLGVGALAGFITGVVYLNRWVRSCEYNLDCDNNPPPSYSQSQSLSQNYTLMAQLTQLVNKSKKE